MDDPKDLPKAPTLKIPIPQEPMFTESPSIAPGLPVNKSAQPMPDVTASATGDAAVAKTSDAAPSQPTEPRIESKPVESKPIEVKPVESKPTESSPASRLEALNPTAADANADELHAAPSAAAFAATKPAPRSRSHRFALLATSLALAAAIGAVAGSLGSAGIMRFVMTTESAVVPASDNSRLEKTVTQLRADVTQLRTTLEASAKNTNAQLARFGERSQAESTAKLTQIVATLDRLERHPVAAAAAAPETTGSIKEAAAPPKPSVLAGWALRDIYNGRALVEGRNGALFEVGPGSSLPGVGRVASIKRQDGKWVVVTPKGIIEAELDSRRRGY